MILIDLRKQQVLDADLMQFSKLILQQIGKEQEIQDSTLFLKKQKKVL